MGPSQPATGGHISEDKTFASRHLVVRGVVKTYQSTIALNGVSFEIGSRQIVALAGGNGAGKSTMLKIVSGAIAPDSGHVEFNGSRLPPGDVREARANGITMVFQDGALCPDATVLENLFLGAEKTSRLGFLQLKTMRQLALETIERYRLPIPSLDSRVDSLSGGQQRGVALGRALLYEPKLLLLDEPTSGLGVREQEVIIASLSTLSSQGVSILLCSHSPDEILAAAERVLVLQRGELTRDEAVNGMSRSELAVLMSGNPWRSL